MKPITGPHSAPAHPIRRAGARCALAALVLSLLTSLGCSAVDPSRLSPRGESQKPIVDAGHADASSDAGPDAADDAGPPPQVDCLGLDENDTCTRPNALTVCVGLDCVLVECRGAFVDCDQEADNGCEATLTSIEHCGICKAACVLPNAETSCEAGECELVGCMDGFGDCDGLESNGCETNLSTVDNCGTCTTSCGAVDNGAPGCAAGECGVGACVPPYGDCDALAENGCEELLANNTHCGACDSGCAPASAVGDCATGACVVVSCTGDLVDCNGLPADGCEASLASPEHCGTCGASCELPRATRQLCDDSGGTPTCILDHGCPEGAASCTPGAPENGCEPGYADCNGLSADGCEKRLDTLTDCGGCGVACSFPGAEASCAGGECTRIGCEPGFGQCAGSDCQSLASDPQNCGECGHACEAGAPNCYGGVCTDATCAPGTADCNGTVGCETDLDTVDDCGVCGLSCGPFPHATAGCDTGSCTIESCDPGYEDCDGVVANGCEVDTRTLDNCGGCGQACVIPGAQTSCSTGSCTFTQCNPGRADCNTSLADGCEVNTTLPGNCGACGRNCGALPNVLSGGCQSQQCSIVCNAGYADCDGNPNNGCETSLTSPGSCGTCGLDCSELPNVVSASCNGNACTNLVCAPGFADCDGITSNGCERSTRTLSDCGACNAPCAPSRATGSCSDGTCRIDVCDSGFRDCNGNAADGCEASMNDPATCGSCSNTCSAGWACQNGICRCTSDEQCGAGESCCDGTCTDTSSVCSLWPCPIASTSRPLLHCGGCGKYCPPVSWFCCAVPAQ